MTDLNKPFKIKHDPETGDIVDIQLKKADAIIDRMATRRRELLDTTNYDLLLPPSDEEKDADDILSIENDWAVDGYTGRPGTYGPVYDEVLSLEDRIDERPIVDYDDHLQDDYLPATPRFREIEAQKAKRSRQWREEASVPSLEDFIENETEASKRTIHAYPYSQTEPMTSEEVAEAYLEDHPSARSKATPPKPSQVHFKPSPEKIKEMAEAFKPMQENFKKIGKSAKQTTKALKKLPATGSLEARGTHLEDRPFHTPEMIALRESLAKNQ